MTPYHRDDWLTVWQGDCVEVMAQMEPESVHCVVTSPPYWGLRDYGTATWLGGDDSCDHVARTGRGAQNLDALGERLGTGGGHKASSDAAGNSPFRDTCGKCGAVRQDKSLGLEPTPEEYVTNMVAVFRAVRRVLRADGTCWVNLGDSYAANTTGSQPNQEAADTKSGITARMPNAWSGSTQTPVKHPFKQKDLVGIPWMVAFALRADGWYLRSDIIWSKPNPMPESVTDRPTKAHEYLFLLSKSPRYFWDADAVREPPSENTHSRGNGIGPKNAATEFGQGIKHNSDYASAINGPVTSRNLRSVWSIDYNADEEVEWTNAIGSCRRCGGLRVAGIGSEPTMSKGMGGSRHPVNGPDLASSERIGSPTRSLWDPSDQDSPSTISAGTEVASTLPISTPSRSASTSSEVTPRPLGTQPRPDASTATTSPTPTLTDVVMASGNAACVCETERGNDGRLSSVLSIATQPYPGAHFATFPEKLVEPCVKAGTSERGVCPECGAPWRRVVEITDEYRAFKDKMRAQDYSQVREGERGGRSNPATVPQMNRTTGWQSPCDHLSNLPGDAVPATVLDPFAGSGTTGRVAQRLGRRAVLIDLNGEYLTQAMKRNQDIPLGLEAG